PESKHASVYRKRQRWPVGRLSEPEHEHYRQRRRFRLKQWVVPGEFLRAQSPVPVCDLAWKSGQLDVSLAASRVYKAAVARLQESDDVHVEPHFGRKRWRFHHRLSGR